VHQEDQAAREEGSAEVTGADGEALVQAEAAVEGLEDTMMALRMRCWRLVPLSTP